MLQAQSFKTMGENNGPLLRLPCPQCDGTTWFNLVRHRSPLGILGIVFSRIEAWSVRCERCGYPIDISREDADRALTLLPISRQRYEKTASEDMFTKSVMAADLQFLKPIALANTTWTCSHCGEECPNTFSECWNCGELNPKSTNQNDLDATDTPSLDRALEDHGADPYGGIKL